MQKKKKKKVATYSKMKDKVSTNDIEIQNSALVVEKVELKTNWGLSPYIRTQSVINGAGDLLSKEVWFNNLLGIN